MATVYCQMMDSNFSFYKYSVLKLQNLKEQGNLGPGRLQ